MKTRIAYGSLALMLVLALSANAQGQLQKHFSDAAMKVKATDNASEKREILNKSFETMFKALDKVERLQALSNDDRAGIDRFKAALQEKRDELAGMNGYERVSDAQLNSFSQYVVQDMEQAAEMITISVVTLLLIVLLIVLLV